MDCAMANPIRSAMGGDTIGVRHTIKARIKMISLVLIFLFKRVLNFDAEKIVLVFCIMMFLLHCKFLTLHPQSEMVISDSPLPEVIAPGKFHK